MPVFREPNKKIGSRAFLLVMAAHGSTLLPLIPVIPIWVTLAALMIVVWRFACQAGWWGFPGRWMKSLLVIALSLVLLIQYRGQLVVEALVSLFVIAFSLKLLEMKTRNDIYLLVYLSFFQIACVFLFFQSLFVTFYGGLIMLLGLAALLQINQGAENVSVLGAMKNISRLLLLVIPLMVVIFIFFPRIGPLWSMPLQNSSGKVGMTDTISPGDIAQLSGSDDLVLRATFDETIPPARDLYWHGLYLSYFNGRQWSTGAIGDAPRRKDAPKADSLTSPQRYSVILEPSDQVWAFVLKPAVVASGDISLNGQGLARLSKPAFQSVQYAALTGEDNQPPASLTPREERVYRQLPWRGNPRTRAWAEALRQENVDDRAMVEAVLRHFNEQPFGYTLRPPLLGEESVDEFLFDTRLGFCSHYAGSFVFLMRAAGIPARVVAGYQGGETSEVGQYVLVHQFDAHAWAEVWLADEGWVRVDPTAAVAPDRVEFGIEEAMREEGSFLSGSPLSPLRYRSIRLISWARLHLDHVNYLWRRWVINYDGSRQLALFARVLDEVTPQRLVLLGLLPVGLIVATIFLAQSWRMRRPRLPAFQREFIRFCRKMERQGLVRQPEETPRAFCLRVGEQMPEWQAETNKIAELYNQLAYSCSLSPADDRYKASLAVLRSKARRL